MQIRRIPLLFFVAVLLLAMLAPGGFARAQATPAGSPPVGSGPGSNVQVGPNGTLDVGGARGADVDLTGENFRGSFGASRQQTGLTPRVGPVSPAPPAPSLRPFYVPSFQPNAADPSPGAAKLDASPAERRSEAADLILPRFRSQLTGSGAHSPPGEAWRFKYADSRWWYWQPNQAWLYWTGAEWRPFPPSR